MKETLNLIISAIVILGLTALWLSAAPTVGTTTASPSVITAGSSTTVTITSSITDPAIIPTSVNLLRLSSSGSPTVVGQLRDDGAGGDVTAGDKVFTIRLSLSEPTAGQIVFQVSAAFLGVLTRSTSASVVVSVAPVGVQLPPDPGEAGKKTLAGIDSNNDGVRDDIEIYIETAVTDSARYRAALRSEATAIQKALLSTTKDQSIQAAIARGRVIECLAYLGKLNDDRWRELLALMLNTEERILANEAHEDQIDGQVFYNLPRNQRRLACTFNPESLPN